MKMETLKQQILTAKGDVRAELVLKNARVINVFTNEIEQADVAIRQGVILGVGHYTGETELDLQGKYVCPGLVDGHIHIESSMLCGPAFEQAVLPHGTTAVVTDPHEISNVAGTVGLDFMLETTKDLALSVYFMLPSCVPATGLDESGAVLEAEQLRPYYQQSRVLGLAELMNSYGTVRADEKILQKICDCTAAGKRIDGHAPFLSGEELNAYVTLPGCSPIMNARTSMKPWKSCGAASTSWCGRARQPRTWTACCPCSGSLIAAAVCW